MPCRTCFIEAKGCKQVCNLHLRIICHFPPLILVSCLFICSSFCCLSLFISSCRFIMPITNSEKKPLLVTVHKTVVNADTTIRCPSSFVILMTHSLLLSHHFQFPQSDCWGAFEVLWMTRCKMSRCETGIPNSECCQDIFCHPPAIFA